MFNLLIFYLYDEETVIFSNKWITFRIRNPCLTSVCKLLIQTNWFIMKIPIPVHPVLSYLHSNKFRDTNPFSSQELAVTPFVLLRGKWQQSYHNSID
ncbi:hypothetical protein KUCAC02_011263 [Chaenocephalus aceratus]|uniref:Uncharacterized protein n=1 Tax=Chaenocephalus aceratus TaxID=36190 RepID=A0ACB9WVE2_CHAAC|nr:hypothetical protein KUCAC02_011263 [Chaenocephalus aceratus]